LPGHLPAIGQLFDWVFLPDQLAILGIIRQLLVNGRLEQALVQFNRPVPGQFPQGGYQLARFIQQIGVVQICD